MKCFVLNYESSEFLFVSYASFIFCIGTFGRRFGTGKGRVG